MIKELTINPQEAAESWPETTFNGHSVLGEVYKASHVFDSWFDDRNYAFQEVYLGYLPETDQFIIGWDVWPPEDEKDLESTFSGGFMLFEVWEKNGKLRAHSEEKKPEIDYRGFYGPNGMYNHLKKQFPGLVDIRLD